MQSIDELKENLDTYKEQLEQVSELLNEDPKNEEYQEMANGLKEVIELTQDLLTAAQQSQEDAGNQPPVEPGGQPQEAGPSQAFAPLQFVSASGHAAVIPVPVVTSGAAAVSARLTVGTAVQGVWGLTTGPAGGVQSTDWRDAVVDTVTTGGYVLRDGAGQLHEVRETRVRLIEENAEAAKARAREALAAVEGEAEATRAAMKQRMMAAAKAPLVKKEVPQKLKILPDDPEDVKAEKKRKIHAFKSRQHRELQELMQDKKQNTWQQFQVKGAKKKAGFLTGRKRDSIFKSPDDVRGKVGVTGSGKEMTDFHKRGKYLNLKANVETVDD